jgi:hypothetical protein
MYFMPAKRQYPADVWGFSPGANFALVISALLTLVLGIFPSGLYKMAELAAGSLNTPPSISIQAVKPAAVAPPLIERASVR